MIDTLEDHYRWDSVGRVFVLLEPDPDLVDVKPQRGDVQAARINTGWELVTAVTLDEVNAQPGVIDVWIRNRSATQRLSPPCGRPLARNNHR